MGRDGGMILEETGTRGKRSPGKRSPGKRMLADRRPAGAVLADRRPAGTVLADRRLAGAALVLALALLGTQTVFAGQWEPQENGGFKYQEEGVYAAEWQQIDGVWYYFDPETGQMEERPELTQTAVCHLLENAVNRAGWYQNERFPIHYKVESASARKMTVAVMLETAPGEATGTLGTFEVDVTKAEARELSTKLALDLYNGQ